MIITTPHSNRCSIWLYIKCLYIQLIEDFLGINYSKNQNNKSSYYTTTPMLGTKGD